MVFTRLIKTNALLSLLQPFLGFPFTVYSENPLGLSLDHRNSSMNPFVFKYYLSQRIIQDYSRTLVSLLVLPKE